MSEHYGDPSDNKDSAEIQRDIDHTRAEMSETLEALRGRLSPGELFEQAISYVKAGGASEFTSNLGDTIKDNPVPTALIGIGLAWLMMGGSGRTTSPSTSSWSGTSGVGSRVSGAAGSASARAGSMMPGAREGAGRAREGAGDMAHEARQRVGELAQGARQQVGETADQVHSQVSHQSERVQASFSYLRQEQPLVLGALGFALGAALGAGLPPTGREDALMGEMRDEYVHKAREMGEEQLDKAKQVAAAAGRAAQEQLQDEGVTQGQAENQARQAAATAERVAHASREAAAQEARHQGLTSSS
jgi:hypothetical protein